MHAPGCLFWVPDPQGCPALLTPAEVKAHAAACKFKIAPCAFVGCNVVLRARDVAAHNRESAEEHDIFTQLSTQQRQQYAQRAAAGVPLQISVKTLTGKHIPISCPANAVVHDVKLLIQDAEGIPPMQQRLIFLSKQLEDGLALAHYDIESGSELHLVLRLIGSDVRLKRAVRPTGRRRHAGALAEYSWQWNEVAVARGYAHALPIGVLAHEVQALLPAAVHADAAGYLLVDYAALLP